MNRKFKNLFSDIAIFAAGNVLSKLVLFFLMPIYTSAMTSSEYGTGELIYNSVELMLPVVTLCLYEAVFRFSIDPGSDHTRLLSNAFFLILRIFLAITLVALLIGYFVRIDYIWSFLLILFTWGIRSCLPSLRGVSERLKFLQPAAFCKRYRFVYLTSYSLRCCIRE